MRAEVVPVRTAAHRRAWVGVPSRLHHDSPGYVPPLRQDALAAMNPRRNPLHRHARIRHYLLVRSGEPVGRVSTTVHPAYVEKFGRKVGFFGHIDAGPDIRDHGMLLAAAERCVTDAGMEALAGPYNYWSGAEFGLPTSDHHKRPAVFQTWYPPYTLPLLEQLGFAPRTRTTGFEVTADRLATVRGPLLASSARISRGTGVTTRPLDMRALESEAELVRTLFGQSFAHSSEALDYPPDVFMSMVRPLRRYLDPELIRFAVKDDRVVGFSFTVPDLNQVLARLGGRLRPMDLIRLRGYVRCMDQAVVLLVGARPDAPMGVAHVLFADTLRAVERGGYRSVHTTWVHEENSTMRGLLTHAAGAAPARDWVVVEKAIAR